MNTEKNLSELNVKHLGWQVLSPDNENKTVAFFHRYDDAIYYACNKWGKYADWKVKSWDKRIPLYPY